MELFLVGATCLDGPCNKLTLCTPRDWHIRPFLSVASYSDQQPLHHPRALSVQGEIEGTFDHFSQQPRHFPHTLCKFEPKPNLSKTPQAPSLGGQSPDLRPQKQKQHPSHRSHVCHASEPCDRPLALWATTPTSQEPRRTLAVESAYGLLVVVSVTIVGL